MTPPNILSEMLANWPIKGAKANTYFTVLVTDKMDISIKEKSLTPEQLCPMKDDTKE